MVRNKHGARLAGDDYQHLYSWWLALAMRMPASEIERVIVENDKAAFTDDVTVHHAPTSDLPDRFYQIKYHVNHQTSYAAENFLEQINGKKSLLEKFWISWKELRNPNRQCELYLVSTWTWKDKDPLGHHIDGSTDQIDIEEFRSAHGKLRHIRTMWKEHLKASDEELDEFLSCLHFRLGYSNSVLVHEQVVERMKWLHLKHDINGLASARTIVREWIKKNTCEIDRERLQAAIQQHSLYMPPERSTIIGLSTIAKPPENVTYDYALDWCDEFEELVPGFTWGYQLKDPTRWSVLLQDLYKLAREVKQHNYGVIKVRGKARLPSCFAFGFIFSEVAGYQLEVEDGSTGAFWRTDGAENKKFQLHIQPSPHGEIIDGEGDTVAISIGISGSPEIPVREWLKQRTAKINAILFISTYTQANTKSLKEAGDAVALAEELKKIMRNFSQSKRARKLLLFYQGPAAGAYFIGHKLNAVCPEIQIMQDLGSGSDYTTGFLLK